MRALALPTLAQHKTSIKVKAPDLMFFIVGLYFFFKMPT